MPESRTVTMPTEALKLADFNPRQGNVAAIKESLEAHGQFRPIVAREDSKVVIAGNHTLRAARELGWKEIEVALIDVDDEQAQRILVVDNRTSDLATNDDELLSKLLQELGTLEGTAYDEDDVDELRRVTGQLADEAMERLEKVLGDRPEVPEGERVKPEYNLMISFTVDVEQRVTVMTALRHIVERQEAPNSNDALVQLVRERVP